jgi:hypothetical protein
VYSLGSQKSIHNMDYGYSKERRGVVKIGLPEIAAEAAGL